MKFRRLDVYRICIGAMLLGITGAASAQYDNAACCQATTSLVQEALRGKDTPSDERFLDVDGPPLNLHILVDTSNSMQELPQVRASDHEAFFDEGEGCTNTSLLAVQAARGWDPSRIYPPPDQGTGLGTDIGKPNLFQDQRYYGYMTWGDSSSPTPTWSTREAACAAQHWGDRDGSSADGDQDEQYLQCLQCLDTKGFYKKPGATYDDMWSANRFIFWGRFLNFNPPKYVLTKVALKQLLSNLRRVRVGISQFGSSSGVLVKPQNPACDQILQDTNSLDSFRSSYIDAVDALRFNKGNSLANALLNIGQYLSSDNDVYRLKFGFSDYVFRTDYTNAALTSQSRSWCWGCQSPSVIILTDGESGFGDTLPPTTLSRMQTLNGGPVTCPADSPCINTGNYKLDDVAKFLANQDLQQFSPPVIGDFDTQGQQSARVHAIAIGTDSNLLKNTAAVGHGVYSRADDVLALQQALYETVMDVGRENVPDRPMSFTTASLTGAQVERAGSAVVPRFMPARNRTDPWQGFLYRFAHTSERLAGCDPANPSLGGDLNHDGDCEDAHLVDADGHAIFENERGDFVKLDSPLTLARPFWEAGRRLQSDFSNSTQWMQRRIYTIVDNSGPGGYPDGKIDRFDTPTAFAEENAWRLREYLGITQDSAACSALATRLGLASLTPDDCARLVIRWYRGADVFNPNPALRVYDRPFLLHDIFHSSPINVEPPLPRASCGDSSQCVPALFSGQTPQQSGYFVQGRPDPLDAYDYYVEQRGGRDQVVLVGSNGGMLHAFHNGRRIAVDPVTGRGEYDAGTGEELWAFIPPDLLPRLAGSAGKHATFVDGTAMVRQVWLDGVGEPSEARADGRKQWSEYRTVAVVGTGGGGVHRFALDLTDLLTADLTSQPRPPSERGSFLWTWPQPCDALAMQVGESFSNFAPHPPPIGPVALSPEADDALRQLAGGAQSGEPVESPWVIAGTSARERWVVALNGGYDAYQSRGRGMALVDLMSGHTVWSFFHGDGKPRSESLRYPIAAGLALADVGNPYSAGVDTDLLFDTATVGDYGGQLWTVRFWVPGTWDSGRQQVGNWVAARSFRVANLAGKTSLPEALRPPFSTIATNVVQPDTGALRTFVGTGDRQNLFDVGTSCRLSNPRACAEQGCFVENTVTIERGGVLASTSRALFDSYSYATGTSSAAPVGLACGGVRARLEWSYSGRYGSCPNDSGDIDFQCVNDSGTLSCREVLNTWASYTFSQPPSTTPQQRFYGIWSYGGDPSRMFNTEVEAADFDSRHFSDMELMNANTATMEPPPLSPGWFVPYPVSVERTATAATVVNGCVLWGSFESRGESGPVCSAAGTHAVRLYQAGYLSGRADCAAGFYTPSTGTWTRSLEFLSTAVPPEPSVQRMSLDGQSTTTSVSLLGSGNLVSVPVSVSP